MLIFHALFLADIMCRRGILDVLRLGEQVPCGLFILRARHCERTPPIWWPQYTARNELRSYPRCRPTSSGVRGPFLYPTIRAPRHAMARLLHRGEPWNTRVLFRSASDNCRPSILPVHRNRAQAPDRQDPPTTFRHDGLGAEPADWTLWEIRAPAKSWPAPHHRPALRGILLGTCATLARPMSFSCFQADRSRGIRG